jgi:hypothetical protein
MQATHLGRFRTRITSGVTPSLHVVYKHAPVRAAIHTYDTALNQLIPTRPRVLEETRRSSQNLTDAAVCEAAFPDFRLAGFSSPDPRSIRWVGRTVVSGGPS